MRHRTSWGWKHSKGSGKEGGPILSSPGRSPINRVIAVCDGANAQRCPIFPGTAQRLNWSFPDPSACEGTWDEKLEQTRQVRDAIEARLQRVLRRELRGRSGLGDSVWNKTAAQPLPLPIQTTEEVTTIKRLIRIVCLLAAMSILGPSAARAQYSGANGTTWNNPMSATASHIIQSNMERRRLQNRLSRNRASSSTRRKSSRRSRAYRSSKRRSNRRAR